jgi:hypothetical protein
MALDELHALTHLVRFIYGATWNLTRKNLYDGVMKQRPLATSKVWSRCLSLPGASSGCLLSTSCLLAPTTNFRKLY